MQLSVIIVNYKTGRMTSECVAAYKRALAGCDCEIIVVDNGSMDDSAQILKSDHPDAKLIESPTNLGYGGAINLGAKSATGKYLVISNSDVFVTGPFAEGLARFYEERGAGVLGIRLVKPDSEVQVSFGHFTTPLRIVCGEIGLLRHFRHPRWSVFPSGDAALAPTQQVDWVTGAFMFVSRDCFERLGGFDRDLFMYYEDVDLCRRAARLGLPTYYVAEYSAVHRHCATSASIVGPAYNAHKVGERRSALIYLRKHHPGQVSAAALALEAIFGFTLVGLSFKYYTLYRSTQRREKNRYKVNTYRKLLELMRSLR